MTSEAGETFTFDLDPAVYRLAAVKKAAYRFAGHFDVRVETPGTDRIRVTLRRLQVCPVWECDPCCFPNEVLDQELRELVAEETRGVRDLLLAQAFSGLSLIDPVGESADFRDDPLGIFTSRSAREP